MAPLTVSLVPPLADTTPATPTAFITELFAILVVPKKKRPLPVGESVVAACARSVPEVADVSVPTTNPAIVFPTAGFVR